MFLNYFIMFAKLSYYFSLVKFSHTIFAMPFAILGFFLAVRHFEYGFDFRVLIFILLCMIFARNAAMAFNRFTDRKIDKLNPRTSNREIPVKKISARASLVFVVFNAGLFVLSAYFINSLCFHLSPIALAVILLYSYTKRFTSLSHFILGLGLAIAPAGAFIAVAENLDLLVIILSLMVFLWTAGFDIIYSLQDEGFDRKNGLFSVPARFGVKKALIISRIAHFGSVLAAFVIGLMLPGNVLYWTGFAIFTFLLIFQHYLVKDGNNKRLGFAFANLNAYASMFYCLFAVISLFFSY